MSSIRQGELAEITGQTVTTIRHMQAHGYTPWDDGEFADGKHRRYNGLHALALIIVDLLKLQGVQVQAACDVVKDQIDTAKRFLDAIEATGEAPELYIARIGYLEESDKVGTRVTSYSNVGTGTKAELTGIINSCLGRLGQESVEGWHTVRIIAGPYVNVVELREAYEFLRRRAFSAGFQLMGRDLLPGARK